MRCARHHICLVGLFFAASEAAGAQDTEGAIPYPRNAQKGAGGGTERRRDGLKRAGRAVETQTQRYKLTLAMRRKEEPGE